MEQSNPTRLISMNTMVGVDAIRSDQSFNYDIVPSFPCHINAVIAELFVEPRCLEQSTAIGDLSMYVLVCSAQTTNALRARDEGKDEA